MAVITTVQDILEIAYSKSTQNNPGTIATESTELLNVVQRMLDGCYAIAARINPIHFAEKATVAGAAGAWPRPEGAESIFQLQDNADDSEIVVVPWDDVTAESGIAAVYEWGQSFYPAGNANDPDPALDSINFFYSKRPTLLTTLTDVLDTLWEEQFNELLALEVAIYLATKDMGTQGRDGELKVYDAERTKWANRFIAFLEHSTANVRRRHGHIRRINTNTLVPLFSVIGATGPGETK